MSALLDYLALERQVDALDRNSAEVEPLLDSMDAHWYAMSEGQRRWLDERFGSDPAA